MASVSSFRNYLCALFLLIVSCGQPAIKEDLVGGPEVHLDLNKIKKRGYLNALVDNNSISYFYYKGGAMGYEYELLKRLTSHLEVELRIKVISSIDDAIEMLNKGRGDIIAFPFTVTSERKKVVEFTEPHFSTSQVLVQRKPDNWADSPHLAEKKMIRNPADLIGKKVYVKKESAFKSRLENLSQELGGEIIVLEDSATAETESLIRKVAEGEIELTVTDQMIAMVNAAYYPNIDIATMVSLPQRIAWALRKNSPELLIAVNSWLDDVKRDGTFNVIYNRYFNNPRTSAIRKKSDYSSLGGNKISIYDDLIKTKAKELGWDWKLLASMIYQESVFIPDTESWAGAQGLMQLMPSTGKYYGAKNLFDPAQNMSAGVNFLKFLDKQWSKTIIDKEERIKFMLASYNVGLSHVLDARNLAIKYGADPTQWEGEVEAFLLKESDPKFYRDPVVKSGYCRCEEPVQYVKEVLERYKEYKKFID
ncbi:MAG: transporter substrate-binding domain-containing protein [Cyclobacteriaceae bacterium]|nr:transporter substrate-binding domain-containing protein [Cyclobacteriaceae bacterium]